MKETIEATVPARQLEAYTFNLSIVRRLSENKMKRDAGCKFKTPREENEGSEYLQRLYRFETGGETSFHLWLRNRNLR